MFVWVFDCFGFKFGLRRVYFLLYIILGRFGDEWGRKWGERIREKSLVWYGVRIVRNFVEGWIKWLLGIWIVNMWYLVVCCLRV